MLEFEKKLLLTSEEYLTLMMTMCKYAPSTIQTNYYFDTNDFAMNEKGITCRIRSKNGKFEATIKSHGEKDSDGCMEKTKEVDNQFDANAFDGLNVQLQGSLVTKRTIMYKDRFCELVLDSNKYLDFTDYELEVEYQKGHEEDAMRLLENVSKNLLATQVIKSDEEFFARIGKGNSKSGRFFAKLRDTINFL